MQDNRYQIGQKVKAIRKRTGYTQEIFSEKIGIEPSSLSNIENGKSYPSMQTVLNIINIFNIAPEDFFAFDYFVPSENIDEKIFEIIKRQPLNQKQLMYKIIKQFDI